jgi:hypothetical protein
VLAHIKEPPRSRQGLSRQSFPSPSFLLPWSRTAIHRAVEAPKRKQEIPQPAVRPTPLCLAQGCRQADAALQEVGKGIQLNGRVRLRFFRKKIDLCSTYPNEYIHHLKIEDKHILISGRPLGPLILLGADFLEFSHLSSTNAQCGEEGTRESAPPEGTRESAPPCMKAEREGNLDAGWDGPR